MTITVWPEPGSVVFVYFLGMFRHFGIVSDRWIDGKPMIIANAHKTKGVREIGWDTFADDRQVYLTPRRSNLPAFQVLYTARCLIGREYDLATFNCEHFVDICHGKVPSGGQIVVAGLAVAGLAVFLVSTSREL